MRRLLFIFLLVGMMISCDKKTENNYEIQQIMYGTSFGECIGYCKSDILLTLGFITYSRSGWVDTVQLTKCTESLSDESWNSFKNNLNPNDFFKLAETIGCPDCADGGAEWIEIEVISGKKHRVTFEYMNEPDALKNIVLGLRQQNEKYVNCGEF